MPNGTPYGGEAWIQQAITAAVQAAMQQINWSQLMGYGYPSMYEPQEASRDEALMAIWENWPEVQVHFRDLWGTPEDAVGEHKDWTPLEAMKVWASWDPEQLEGRTAAQWATEQGWLAGREGVPTLERQRMEADEAYRQALLEFDQAKQQFIEGFAYDEMALNEALERLRLSQEQQRYMNEYEIAQAQLALQQELGMGDLQLRELMRLDQVSQYAAELDWAREMYYDQATFAGRQQDWAEWMGRSDLELRQELADLESRIALGELDLAERRFTLEDFLARSQSERENKYYELEYVMAMSQEERAGQRFQFEQQQWGQQFGLEQQRFELEQRQFLASLRGPQDWPQYWAASRAMPEAWGPQGQPIPAWQQMLQSGQPFPAFGAEGGVPLGAGYTQPQQVSPQQWWSMAPSEMEGLQGMVETGGGWMPDWMRAMQAAWPQGQATPISYFGA